MTEGWKRALSTIFHLVLVAVIILVWEQVPEKISQLLQTPPGPIARSIIAYSVTIALLIFVTFLFDRLLRSTSIVEWSRDRELAKFEGKWAQKVALPERPSAPD
jgi:hypothetical protein